jgi:hypothetical protein
MKFLYTRKQALNETLYKIHLKVTSEWGKTWNSINQYITQKLDKRMGIKYKTIHNKTRKLSSIPQTNKTPNTFYKRTENLTKIPFTGEEIHY